MRSLTIEHDDGFHQTLESFTNLSGEICFGKVNKFLTVGETQNPPLVQSIQIGNTFTYEDCIVSIFSIEK